MHRIAKDAGDLARRQVKLSKTELIEARKRHLDYSGSVIEAPNSRLDSPMPIPWALGIQNLADRDDKELLDREIDQFAKYMDPTPSEKNRKGGSRARDHGSHLQDSWTRVQMRSFRL